MLAAAFVRQQPLFDGHRDRRTGNSSPFEACSVISVTRSTSRLPGVGVVDQAGFFQKRLQLARAAAPLVEIAGHGQQFLDVGQPLLVFLVFRASRTAAGSRVSLSTRPSSLFDRPVDGRRQAIEQRHELGHSWAAGRGPIDSMWPRLRGRPPTAAGRGAAA